MKNRIPHPLQATNPNATHCHSPDKRKCFIGIFDVAKSLIVYDNADSKKFRVRLHTELNSAAAHGRDRFDIKSGELHRAVGDYPGQNYRMPTCCCVMHAEIHSGDEIISAPPKDMGANLSIRYKLPRTTRTVDVASIAGVGKFHRQLHAELNEEVERGLVRIDINALDLHLMVIGEPARNDRLPECCDAMFTEMKERDRVLIIPPEGKGGNLKIRYKLPILPSCVLAYARLERRANRRLDRLAQRSHQPPALEHAWYCGQAELGGQHTEVDEFCFRYAAA